MTTRRRFPLNPKFILGIKLVISGMLLYLVFRKISLPAMLALVKDADPRYLGGALALLTANMSLHFISWRMVLRFAGHRPPVRQVAASMMVGYTFGIVTPGGIGEIGRGVYFRNASRFQMIGLSAVDRFYSLYITVVLGCAGCAWYFGGLRSWLFAVAAMGLMTAASFPGAVCRRLYRLAQRLPAGKERVGLLLESLQGISGPRSLVLAGVYWLFYLVCYLQMYLLLRAFGAPVAFLPAAAVTSMVVMIKALLPVTVGDLGLRENLMVYFFGQAPFFLVPEMAFNASFMLFGINLLLPGLLGTFFVPRIDWRRRPKAQEEKA